MIQSAIGKVVDGKHLTEQEAAEAMIKIMRGEATPSQIAAFLTALRMKGETVDEIVGCARVMRDEAARISPKAVDLVDTCGTGGDGANTFNISTAASFVIAGAGLSVAKHGNRSVSSKSGTADVLEVLGVRIELSPKDVEQCIDEVGMGFMFAPRFHTSMKHALAPRKEVGIRTIFNLLGPLTNPASAKIQVVGVYEKSLTEPIARVLNRLDVKEAFVVHGLDRLDEISISGPTQVSHLRDGQVETLTLAPEDFGLKRHDRLEIEGGTPEDNAKIIKDILRGLKGAKRDVVLINAAAALVAARIATDFAEGIELAADSIDTGRAAQKLGALIEYTRSRPAS